MRSLFAKILAWFVVALLATVAAFVVATVVTYNPYTEHEAPFSMLLNLELTEARRAFEEGGPERLRATLERFCTISNASAAMLTDAQGKDLVTGESRANMLPNAEVFVHWPFSGRSQTFGRKSSDGRFVLLILRRTWYFWFLQPAHLWVIVLIVLLCYLLARYVTSPVRNLRSAMDRFGRGDLTARAEARRHDELGDLAASFNGMAAHIQTLLAAERRLLFDISHELRSPLARLSVAVELARTNEISGAPLDRIQREADRLNSLIRQMLEVTRTEGEPSRMKVEHLQLDELITGLVDDCSIEAQALGCELVLSPCPEIPIDGDRELLRRAIENVMRNAIRYAPFQSRIEVSMENGGRWATVRIRDYGPGVPEESLPRLFDPFYRVGQDRDRKSGGVGLGLAIARRAVELHKGHLRAANASPGLLVEIELPV